MMEECGEDQRTVWCGNLSEKMTEEVLYELFLQAAPLERVHIPKDKNGKSNYGFVTFKHSCSVPYAIDLLNGIALYNKKITVKPRCKNIDQPKPFNSYNMNNVPNNVPKELPQRMEQLEEINLLMQLGDQLLFDNNRHYFAGDYRNERPTNNVRERSNYYNDRREDSRPYRRSNHYHNNRNNSVGRSHERRHNRY